MREKILYSDKEPKNRYFIVVRESFFGKSFSCFIYDNGKITVAIKDKCGHNIFRSEILFISYNQKESYFTARDKDKCYKVLFSFGKHSSVTFVCESTILFEINLSDRACRQVYSALMYDCDTFKTLLN